MQRRVPKTVSIERLLLAQDAALTEVVEKFIPIIGQNLDEFDISPLAAHPQTLSAVTASAKKAFAAKKRKLNEVESTVEQTKFELGKQTALLAEVKHLLQKIKEVVPSAIPASKMHEGKRMDYWVAAET